MKLIYSPTSPFVRKVMVLLHETGQLADVEIHQVATTPMSPDSDVQAANPLAKIPALVLNDGPTLYDSRVVCAYLDERADSGLYASGWDAKVLEATGDGIMDAAVSATYERRMRPEDKQYDVWIAAQLGKVLSACSTLNDRWISHLVGPLDMGQISVGCALSYVDYRHQNSNWRDGNKALADWHADFESRPSMQATQPPAV